MEHLGPNIRAERARRGWSQAELGRRIERSAEAIREIERTSNTTTRTLQAIADAMGILPEHLVAQVQQGGQRLAVDPDQTDTAPVVRVQDVRVLDEADAGVCHPITDDDADDDELPIRDTG